MLLPAKGSYFSLVGTVLQIKIEANQTADISHVVV